MQFESAERALVAARKRLLTVVSVKPWKVAILYSLAALGPFATDHLADFFGEPQPDRWYSPLINWTDPNWLYQRSFFGSARGIAPDFVSVVVISPDKEPESVTSSNVCLQRAFLARVVEQIAQAHPGVIAIDKSYGCSACLLDDPGTAALRNILGRLSRRVPVVIGLRTEDLNDITKGDERLAEHLRAKGMDGNDQILLPSLDLAPPDAAGALKYGLIRINKDIRRVPLGWKTYASRSVVDPSIDNAIERRPECASIDPGHRVVDTLSIAAARAFNSRRINNGLERMQSAGVHPFPSFFRDDDLKNLSVSSAIEVLCGNGSGKNTDWKTCQRPLAAQYTEAFRNRVVFIGERSQDDFWTPVGKPILGVVLQASYTESLIEQRYLRPVARGADVLISLAWLLIVEWGFRRWQRYPERALALSLLSTAMLMLLFYRFLIVEAGIYFNLWPPSIAAISFRYLGEKVPKYSKGDGE
jgi:hypothetical protein